MQYADVSYLPFSRTGQVVKSDYFLRYVCFSVRLSARQNVLTEQLSSHLKDLYEILYNVIFRRSVENSQVSLKSDNNYNGYFTRRSVGICDNTSILLNYSYNEQYFRHNL